MPHSARQIELLGLRQSLYSTLSCKHRSVYSLLGYGPLLESCEKYKLRKLRISLKTRLGFFCLESKSLSRAFAQWNILSTCILCSSAGRARGANEDYSQPPRENLNFPLLWDTAETCTIQPLTGTEWKFSFCFPSVPKLHYLPKRNPCEIAVLVLMFVFVIS